MTLSIPSNVATITLTDGRTFRLDGSVPATVATAAIATTPNRQRTPKAKPAKAKQAAARKPLTGEALAKQVKFWSGPASKGQIQRLKDAGSKQRATTLSQMSALEARSTLAKLDPNAKLAVIPAEVLALIAA